MTAVALVSLAAPASAQEPLSLDDCLQEGIALENEVGAFVCNFEDADYDEELCSDEYGGAYDEETGLCTVPLAEAEVEA